jgi:hypothetical protein
MRHINLDGMLHFVGGVVCGCRVSGIMGKACRKCGALVHQQPIYGGIAEACERCDDDWIDGEPPKHDEIGVVLD